MAAKKTPLSILFLITARGGSKRLPGKNLKRIRNLSLIGFKAISARKSRYCSHLAISSEDAAIQAEAAAYGVEVPFTRPVNLADDVASSDDVVMHAITYFENEERQRYDAIMLLEPTTPFARAADYDAGVEIFMRKKASLVVGMRRTDVNSIFVGPLERDGRATEMFRKIAARKDIRGQSFEPEFTMNGAFYLIDWEHMKKTGKIFGDPENTYGYPMDHFHSVEIDTLYDLRLAEFLVDSGDVDLGGWL